MRNVILGLIALACVVGLGGAITMSGSTTVLPVGVALSEDYRVAHVFVSGGGTGSGLVALAEGNVDIAMASRVITKDEAARVGAYNQTLIGYDGLIIITGGDVGITSITRQQLAGIYDKTYTNWKDIGGIDAEILPIGREEGSGTRDTFLSDVMKDKLAECPGEMVRCMSSAEVLQAVKQSPGSVGYVGYSYAKGVNVLAFDGKYPTEDAIKHRQYSLARELFFYTKQNTTQEIKDFMSFVVTTKGQDIVFQSGFIPL